MGTESRLAPSTTSIGPSGTVDETRVHTSPFAHVAAFRRPFPSHTTAPTPLTAVPAVPVAQAHQGTPVEGGSRKGAVAAIPTLPTIPLVSATVPKVSRSDRVGV